MYLNLLYLIVYKFIVWWYIFILDLFIFISLESKFNTYQLLKCKNNLFLLCVKRALFYNDDKKILAVKSFNRKSQLHFEIWTNESFWISNMFYSISHTFLSSVCSGKQKPLIKHLMFRHRIITEYFSFFDYHYFHKLIDFSIMFF